MAEYFMNMFLACDDASLGSLEVETWGSRSAAFSHAESDLADYAVGQDYRPSDLYGLLYEVTGTFRGRATGPLLGRIEAPR